MAGPDVVLITDEDSVETEATDVKTDPTEVEAGVDTTEVAEAEPDGDALDAGCVPEGIDDSDEEFCA